MSFPNILNKVYMMRNSDINVVGEFLGYKWNDICSEISKENFYASDGDGTIIVSKEENGIYCESEKINKIMQAIFENNPDVEEVIISN